jgi:hypothetical protein
MLSGVAAVAGEGSLLLVKGRVVLARLILSMRATTPEDE